MITRINALRTYAEGAGRLKQPGCSHAYPMHSMHQFQSSGNVHCPKNVLHKQWLRPDTRVIGESLCVLGLGSSNYTSLSAHTTSQGGSQAAGVDLGFSIPWTRSKWVSLAAA
jgi:hypothetical protein